VHAAEQPAFTVTRDASGLDVGVQVALKSRMAGHLMPIGASNVAVPFPGEIALSEGKEQETKSYFHADAGSQLLT